MGRVGDCYLQCHAGSELKCWKEDSYPKNSAVKAVVLSANGLRDNTNVGIATLLKRFGRLNILRLLEIDRQLVV